MQSKYFLRQALVKAAVEGREGGRLSVDRLGARVDDTRKASTETS